MNKSPLVTSLKSFLSPSPFLSRLQTTLQYNILTVSLSWLLCKCVQITLTDFLLFFSQLVMHQSYGMYNHFTLFPSHDILIFLFLTFLSLECAFLVLVPFYYSSLNWWCTNLMTCIIIISHCFLPRNPYSVNEMNMFMLLK